MFHQLIEDLPRVIRDPTPSHDLGEHHVTISLEIRSNGEDARVSLIFMSDNRYLGARGDDRVERLS